MSDSEIRSELSNVKNFLCYSSLAADSVGLTSLKGCPDELLGSCIISRNPQLSSLEYGPSFVGGNFHAADCSFTSLVGAPREVKGNFVINRNERLTSLVGGPSIVGGKYTARYCELTSLIGIPSRIGGGLSLTDNPLTSLQGINKLKEMRGLIDLEFCQIKSHILGVFLIKGCSGIHTKDRDILGQVEQIVNAHIMKGRSGMLACQQELIDAGLSDFAQI
jgi:hypothetical protein